MAIDKIGQQAIQTYGSQRDWAVANVTSQSQMNHAPEAIKPKRDQVEISETAQQLQRAMNAVREAPDVREDKVAAIRQRIADGTYYVPAETLLEKILGSLRNG
jgi:negative regulator of flagellin synthesis FlgM